MLKKKIVSTAAVLFITLTPMVATVPAYAADTNTITNHNFFQGLVDFLSQRFGLDKTQVQSAVNEYHTQQMQNRQQKMQDNEKKRLDKLVSEGKITSSQEQAIITELQNLRTKYSPDSFKGLTPDQRKQRFQDMQNEITSWAKSQGIDPKYVMPFPGMGMGMRMGFRMGKWAANHPTPTTTQ